MKAFVIVAALFGVAISGAAEKFPFYFFFERPDPRVVTPKKIVFRVLSTEVRPLPKEEFPDGGDYIAFSAEIIEDEALNFKILPFEFLSSIHPTNSPFGTDLKAGQIVHFRMHYQRGQWLHGIVERVEEPIQQPQQQRP